MIAAESLLTVSYKANLNLTTRTVFGNISTLVYNYENQLTTVSGATSGSFSYDGDGKRVKGTVGGVTTAYVGNYFEWTNAGSTAYYYAGGQRIAMRRAGYTSDNGLFWLLGDHLGSTTVTANSAGVRTAELRYKPWGQARTGVGTTRTSYRFTGQRSEEAGIGLYWYNSRWYDALIGRFASPDSIIPQSQGVLAWDRYAYVNNSPVNYTDPTGHMVVQDGPQNDRFSKYLVDKYMSEHPSVQAQQPIIPDKNNAGPQTTNLIPPISNSSYFQLPNQQLFPDGYQPICSVPPTLIKPWSGPFGDLNPYHPDYASIGGSIGIPGFPGFSGGVTIDRYSNVYGSLGINLGKSYVTGWSVAVTGGWIGGNPLDSHLPQELDVEDFLSGFALNVSGGAGPGAGVTWSPFASGPDQIAFETGMYSPQVGITASWSWLIIDHR